MANSRKKAATTKKTAPPPSPSASDIATDPPPAKKPRTSKASTGKGVAKALAKGKGKGKGKGKHVNPEPEPEPIDHSSPTSTSSAFDISPSKRRKPNPVPIASSSQITLGRYDTATTDLVDYDTEEAWFKDVLGTNVDIIRHTTKAKKKNKEIKSVVDKLWEAGLGDTDDEVEMEDEEVLSDPPSRSPSPELFRQTILPPSYQDFDIRPPILILKQQNWFPAYLTGFQPATRKGEKDSWHVVPHPVTGFKDIKKYPKRSIMYLHDDKIATCTIGEVHTEQRNFTCDARTRSSSPPPSSGSTSLPSQEEFDDLSRTDQLRLLRPHLLDIINDRYEPSLHRLDKFYSRSHNYIQGLESNVKYGDISAAECSDVLVPELERWLLRGCYPESTKGKTEPQTGSERFNQLEIPEKRQFIRLVLLPETIIQLCIASTNPAELVAALKANARPAGGSQTEPILEDDDDVMEVDPAQATGSQIVVGSDDDNAVEVDQKDEEGIVEDAAAKEVNTAGPSTTEEDDAKAVEPMEEDAAVKADHLIDDSGDTEDAGEVDRPVDTAGEVDQAESSSKAPAEPPVSDTSPKLATENSSDPALTLTVPPITDNMSTTLPDPSPKDQLDEPEADKANPIADPPQQPSEPSGTSEPLELPATATTLFPTQTSTQSPSSQPQPQPQSKSQPQQHTLPPQTLYRAAQDYLEDLKSTNIGVHWLSIIDSIQFNRQMARKRLGLPEERLSIHEKEQLKLEDGNYERGFFGEKGGRIRIKHDYKKLLDGDKSEGRKGRKSASGVVPQRPQ